MKYLLLGILILGSGCGSEGAKILDPMGLTPWALTVYEEEDLTPWHNVCVTNNLNLIPAAYQVCLSIHSEGFCDGQSLGFEVHIQNAWVYAQLESATKLNSCLAYDLIGANSCYVDYEMWLTYWSSTCKPAGLY